MPEPKKGFQKVALMAGVPVEIVEKLAETWPESVEDALFDAGHEPGPSLFERANLIESRRPKPATTAEPPPPASSALPQKIEIVQKTEGPQEWMAKINAGNRTADILQSLYQATDGQPVFVAAKDNHLDIEASLQAINHLMKHGKPPARVGKNKCRTLWDALAEVSYNDPLTGQPLDPGDPWYSVSPENRLRAAYAVAAGYLPNTTDKWTIMTELKRPSLAETRWEQWDEEFQAAKEDDSDEIIAKARRLYAGRPEWAKRFFDSVPPPLPTQPGPGRPAAVTGADRPSTGFFPIKPAGVSSLSDKVITGVIMPLPINPAAQASLKAELKWLFAAADHLFQVRRGLVPRMTAVPEAIPPRAEVGYKAANNIPANLDDLSLQTYEGQIKNLAQQIETQLKGLETEANPVSRRRIIIERTRELAHLIYQIYGIMIYGPDELTQVL